VADAKRIIELVFEGVDKTGAATQAALNNTQKFAGSVQSATQPVADFTVSAVKLEAALLASGVAVTAFAVKVAGDFDSAFREISTLIDQPIESLNEFRDAILSYANSSTQPLDQVTQAIYNAISAGVDFEDSIAAVSQAERLAVAGKADLNDALLVLVSSLNAYGLGMDEAGRFSDALFQTVADGQTNLPELAASLSQVTSIAATTGVDFEELLAALAALTSTGTPTAQAVTQIRGALSSILKPTSDAASLAQELGLNFSLQRLEAVGLSGVLADVQQATSGSAEQMGRLFGSVEGLNAVLTLTGLGADKFAENLLNMENKAGATEAAFQKMSDQIGFSGQKISNALNGLLVSVGTPLLNEFNGVADAIAGIFNALGESANTGQVAELVAFIEQEFAGLEQTLQAVAQNLPAALESADLSGFSNGVKAVSDSLGVLFAGIDLTTVDGLASAITFVGQAFEGLSQFTGGVIESLRPLFEQISKVGGGLEDLNPELFKAAGELAGFATQANALAGAVNNMIPALQGLVAIIGLNQAAGLVGALRGAAGALAGGGGLLALLGPAGLVAAAGGAGVAVGTLANKAAELATGASLSDRLSDWFTSFTGLDDQASALERALDPLPAKLEEIVVSGRRIEPNLRDPLEEIVVTAQRVESAFQGQARSVSDIIPVYDEVTGKLIGYTDGISSAADIMNVVYESSTSAADGIRDLGEAAQGLQLEEKLALIDARSQVMTAQIAADADKVTAAYDSINVAIESTGDLINELYGLLGDDNIRKLDKLDIRKQIEEENARRQQEFDLQKKLTEAQIAEMRQRREALKNGGGIITVNGDGLQPHLEAFMFEILSAIQVRVNAAGEQLLLGI
jgi:TP901 family phage tail tape measure protein